MMLPCAATSTASSLEWLDQLYIRIWNGKSIPLDQIMTRSLLGSPPGPYWKRPFWAKSWPGALLKLDFGILAALQVPIKTSFWECLEKAILGQILARSRFGARCWHFDSSPRRYWKRGPIVERQELSEMHKKVQGQDLAPDPLKRAFFSIEIISFLGAENFRFLGSLSWRCFCSSPRHW